MAVDILNAQNMRELCFQENDCRPSFAIKVPSEASSQQMIDTENRFNSKFRGHQNTGKFVTLKDSEIVPLGFSPKDLEGMNLRREMKQEIFAAYGISEAEFSTNDANLASSITGNLQFYRTIKPLLIKNAEELTNSLIPLFYPDAEDGEYFFAYDEIIPEVAKPQLTAAERVSLGIVSINEMRAEIGLSPIEGGDALRVNGQTLSNLDASSMVNTMSSLVLPAVPAPATLGLGVGIQMDPMTEEPACSDANCTCGGTKGLETVYSPNDRMVEEALRGMLWSMEYNRGGDEASRKIASTITQRGRIDIDVVRQMAVYFANMKLQVVNQGWDGGEGYPNADRITYAMYGGDAGKAWTLMVMGGIQPVGDGRELNTVIGPDEGALAAPASEHKVVPPVSYNFEMAAGDRVAERNDIWRKKIYCDHKTDTKMARKEVNALTSVVNDLYLKASTSLKVHADGTIDLGNFEDMLAAKLGEYLFPTMYRGAQDAAVRLEAMTRGKSFKNIKAAVPNLDVVPETALESLANYVISLSRQITQNETDELKAALDEGMRQGLSLDTITKNIKTAINENATFKAERIARTETARAYITGQSVTWREAGVEKVEPILAPNSCTLCADLVSKGAYPIDTRSGDRVPFHPNCRCDEVPVLE
jgi:SPP1 gp7 family putative phage head morphogenesis protein